MQRAAASPRVCRRDAARALAPIACASARPRAERPVPSANAPGGRGFGRDLTPLTLPQVVGIVVADERLVLGLSRTRTRNGDCDGKGCSPAGCHSSWTRGPAPRQLRAIMAAVYAMGPGLGADFVPAGYQTTGPACCAATGPSPPTQSACRRQDAAAMSRLYTRGTRVAADMVPAATAMRS